MINTKSKNFHLDCKLFVYIIQFFTIIIIFLHNSHFVI